MTKLLAATAAIAAILASAPAFAGDTGFHGGFTVGYGQGNHDTEMLEDDHRSTGFASGLELGYEHVSGDFVFGVEADYSWTGIESDERITHSPAPGMSSTIDIRHDISNLATLRAKVGRRYSGFTPYLTAGFARGTNESSADAVNTGFGAPYDGAHSGSHSQSHTGWAAGAGADFELSPSLFMTVEYLHADLGEERYTALPNLDATPRSHEITADLLRVGVSYRF